MPGTILVSVLELMDLPLSSSTSLRASIGKIEYQISDKGSISFALTSLRDNLVFRIQDAEGNEISRIGFQIRMILEKGVWEDTFPLGKGNLHLKLQFILSDEERDRIRTLRQSALKKKHDELLSSSRRNAESGSGNVIGYAALPFRTNDEVSESPKKRLQHEAVSQLQSPVGYKESDTSNAVLAEIDKKQLKPNIADQYKETSHRKPVSQAVNVSQLQHKGKKPVNQSPSEEHPQRVLGSEDEATLLASEKIDVMTKNLTQPEEDGVQYSEKKKIPQGRTPSNVRKMISAFETGLAQDMRPHIKPPPTKYQASTIEREDSQHLEQDKSRNAEPAGFLEEREKGVSPVRNLLQVTDARNKYNNQTDSNATNIFNNQADSNATNKFKVAYKTDLEEEKNNKSLMRTSTFETVLDTGKMTKNSDTNHPYKPFGSKKDSILNQTREEKKMKNASEVQMDSLQKPDSVVPFDHKYHSYESSGVWIFPDEQRKICLTTSGKNVMDIVEIQHTKNLSHQRSLHFSKLENVEKNADNVGARAKGDKYKKIQETEQSNFKTSDDNGDENPGGPVNQVIRVAIIVGFGILVLLTRQRKQRMKKKNA